MFGVYRRNNFDDVDDGRNATCGNFNADLAGNNLDFLQVQKLKKFVAHRKSF